MKDSELQFDRSCHVLYSKQCKKEILAKIALCISFLQNGLLQSTNRSLRKIGRIRFSSISSISRKDVTALQTV